MIKKNVLVLLIVSITLSGFGESVRAAESCIDPVITSTNWTINASHPRLYIYKEDYPRLRDQITREPYKTVYDSFRSYVDSHLNDIENNDTNGNYVLPTALVYVFTDNGTYRDSAIKILENRALAGIGLSETDYLAIDFVFEDLSAQQKTDFWVWMSDTETFYGLNASQYDPDPHYGYHFGDHFRTPLGMALIYLTENFSNPTEYYPDLIADIMRKSCEQDNHYWKISQRVGGDPTYNPALNGTIGGLYDMFGYDTGGEHNNHKLNYMYSHATGFDKISNWLHLKGMGAFYQQMYVPHTVHTSWASNDPQHNMPQIWDTTTSRVPEPKNRALATSLYGDPYMQWWVNHGSQADVLAQGNFAHNTWRWLIFYNDSLGELPPSSHPTANYFNGPGFVVMRSDWTDNATYMFMMAPDHFSRSYENANSFILHRKTALIPHNGYRSTIRSSSILDQFQHFYATLSAAKNTILVFDPEESWDYVICTGGAPLPFHTGQKLGYWENMGGQEWSSVTPGSWPDYCDGHDRDNISWYSGQSSAGFSTNNLSYKEQSNIIKFEHIEGSYTYTVGDATQAYTQKINLFEREMVYLRPNIFVIFDRVNSTNSSYRKVWVMHSVFEPFFDSPTIKENWVKRVSNNTKVTTIRGTKICGQGVYEGKECTQSTDGCGCVGTGSTDMFLNTVIPSNNTVTKRGGIQYLINDSTLSGSAPIPGVSITQPSYPSGFSMVYSTLDDNLDQRSISVSGVLYNGSVWIDDLALSDTKKNFAYGEPTSSTTTSVTDNTRNWGVDEYKDFMVQVMINGSWVYRRINSNNETSLLMDDLGGIPEDNWNGRFYVFKYRVNTHNLWRNITQISTNNLNAFGVDLYIKHWMTAEDEGGMIHTFHPDYEYSPTNGRWVINIEPQEENYLDNFLNVAYLTDQGNCNVETEVVRNNYSSGVLINNSYMVLFSNSGCDMNQTQYVLNTSGTIKHLILDLIPGTTYYVYDNLVLNQILNSSDQGTLFFNTTLGSQHTYLVSAHQQGHMADTNDDGLIDMPELVAYIARWKANDGVSRQEVDEARDIWFTGGAY